MVVGLLCVLGWTCVSSLKICSFNIQSFGSAKMEKPEVVEVLLNVVSRCDIMLVMEIKDASGTAFPLLITRLNSRFSNRPTNREFNYIISTRLGRRSYKEQYAFIYRKRLVSVRSTYQYPDTQLEEEDVFSREPFIIWFSSPNTYVKDFVIVPIHTTPEASVREIDGLYDVLLDMRQRWESENYILLGDFNAACAYVPRKHWGNIRLRSNSSFLWLTDDSIDTTVKESTHCAYDRVVLHGKDMITAVSPDSLEVFDFKQEYGLTEQQALAVSDHFPVSFTVRAAKKKRPMG
ncbi:deoxyribonuclease gamma-like [Aplochiton taeniatus]